MEYKAVEIIEQALMELISNDEATEYLAELEVHGAFGTHGYIGYNYKNQEWIEVKY